MREKTISWRFLTAGSLVLLCLLLMVITFGCEEKTEEAVSEEQTKEVSGKKSDELIGEEQTKQFVFNLDEVSVFDVGELSRYFLRGQSTSCKDEPYRPVKYPVFKSKKALYGRISFAGRTAEFHAPAGYHFALDEPAGTDKSYDRFYFDHNCDRIRIGKKSVRDSLFVGNYIEIDDVLYRPEIASDGAYIKLSKAEDVKFGNIRLPKTITEFSAGGENGLFTLKPEKGTGSIP